MKNRKGYLPWPVLKVRPHALAEGPGGRTMHSSPFQQRSAPTALLFARPIMCALPVDTIKIMKSPMQQKAVRRTYQTYRTKISGTGSYFPEKKLTNKDLEPMIGATDQWIRQRTGIGTRCIASQGQCTSDLALLASQRAMEMAQLEAQSLDMIIFATFTPDHHLPSAACELQKKLGAKSIMAFDLAASCAGFVYALSVADQFIKGGHHKHILVVGAEVLHPIVNYKDSSTAILFGDGAGAAIVSQASMGSNSYIISSHHCYADGSLSHLLNIPAGGSLKPFNQEELNKGHHYMKMHNGREMFRSAVRIMSEGCRDVLKANKMGISDVHWVVPHQANLRVIQAVADNLDLPMEKVVVEIEDVGNVGGATIPTAMDRAIRDGRIQRGQNIILTAFGAGITHGSILMKF